MCIRDRYKDVPCKSIFVKFAVTDDKGVITKLLGTKENVYFVIWTTTTWTIPGNLAISLNPNFEYDFVKVPNGEIYVLAKELVASVMKTADIDKMCIRYRTKYELDKMFNRVNQ